MRNGKLPAFLIALMLLVFAAGLVSVLYPYIWGAMVDREISLNAQGFLNRDKTEPTISEVLVTMDSPTEPEETRDYPELWTDIPSRGNAVSSVESLSCPNLTEQSIVLRVPFRNAGVGMPKGNAFSIGISAFKGQKSG